MFSQEAREEQNQTGSHKILVKLRRLKRKSLTVNICNSRDPFSKFFHTLSVYPFLNHMA